MVLEIASPLFQKLGPTRVEGLVIASCPNVRYICEIPSFVLFVLCF